MTPFNFIPPTSGSREVPLVVAAGTASPRPGMLEGTPCSRVKDSSRQVLALEHARRDIDRRLRPDDQDALAYRTRLSGPQARSWIGPLRGSRVAWLPPSRKPLHRCLWFPDRPSRDDSPLSFSPPQGRPDASPSQWSPTPRLPGPARAPRVQLHDDHAAAAHPRPRPAPLPMSMLQSTQHILSSHFMTQ
jgi:hypothetical protein